MQMLRAVKTFYRSTVYYNLAIIIITTCGLQSCQKLVAIPSPVSSIASNQVFSTDGYATEAMTGVYYTMINDQVFSLTNREMTIAGGLSADEFLPYNTTPGPYVQYQQNNLFSTNNSLRYSFWSSPYNNLYKVNAILAGLDSSSAVHDSVKNELIGEAKFIRAFYNFYLVNLYGDVPLVTTTTWRKTNILGRTPALQVYQAIVADLKDAQARLPADFSVGNGERIIPNRWAVKALLARVYLYLRDWSDAETEAATVINSTNFNLTGLDSVFLSNSPEAIWQLKQNIKSQPFNATPEQFSIDPNTAIFNPPLVYLTPTILGNFEAGDNRQNAWITKINYNSDTFSIPYKYKIGEVLSSPTAGYSEYYMVLRLAEQYLIRAEARIQLGNDLSGATKDLNAIRLRAGLAPLSVGSAADLTAAFIHEDQIEFFAEWGHRWLDLKRWGIATSILSANKGLTVSTNALLFPIPVSDIITDPNLRQNPGYQ